MKKFIEEHEIVVLGGIEFVCLNGKLAYKDKLDELMQQVKFFEVQNDKKGYEISEDEIVVLNGEERICKNGKLWKQV